MHDEPRYFNAQDKLFHCLDMPPRVRSRQPLPKILLPRLAKLKKAGRHGLAAQYAPDAGMAEN
jgi:hypothetical protein